MRLFDPFEYHFCGSTPDHRNFVFGNSDFFYDWILSIRILKAKYAMRISCYIDRKDTSIPLYTVKESEFFVVVTHDKLSFLFF